MANIIQQTEEYFLNGLLDIIDLGPIGEILYNEYVKIDLSTIIAGLERDLL